MANKSRKLYHTADKYIKAKSYRAYVNMQDLDLWTDANTIYTEQE